MAWVIIGCTILIIVCLGGGNRLAQILLGTIALIGLIMGSPATSASQAPP